MIDVTQRASVVSQNQSVITDEEALQILLHANTPNAQRSWSPGRCATPASSRGVTPATRLRTNGGRSGRSTSKRRGRGGQRGSSELHAKEDEEAACTRRFWENWAVEATQSLLSDVQEEEERKQLVFSGRCGPEPKFHTIQRSGSQESVHTDISLLACSELNHKDSTKHTRRAQKKNKAPKSTRASEVNWEMFSRERKGMLDRFIEADTSRLAGYMRDRSAPVQNVIQKLKATDFMSKQERIMLRKCAYGRGLTLANNNKSCSTENIITVVNPAQRLHGGKLIRGVTWENDPTPDDSARDEVSADGDTYPWTPSPAAIVESLNQNRPESAMPALNPVEQCDSSSRASSASSRLSWGGVQPTTFNTKSVRYGPSRASPPTPPMSTKTYRKASRKYSTLHGLPDLEGVFSSKVKKKIRHTISDLNKATGFGDRTDVSVPIEEEQGVYTEADYARHPRYPQNIRIAPHLSKVIQDDIRDRMGRPRRHEVKIPDLQAYDADQPALGRSHRNLLIFNWINSVTESHYEDLDVPDIADLEGDPPKRSYPKFVPGIVGEEDSDSLATANSVHFDDVDSNSDVSRSDFDSNDSFYD